MRSLKRLFPIKRTFLFIGVLLFTVSPLSAMVGVSSVGTASASCGNNGDIVATNGSYVVKPDLRLGEVALDQAATFLADMSDITGAYYDQSLDRIVFIGKTQVSAPKFNKDDLAVAIRSLVFNNTIPRMGMWPNGSTTTLNVTYDGGIENTKFGKALLDADYMLKKYMMGYHENGMVITSSVPTYKSYNHRYIDLGVTPGMPESGGALMISPEYVNLKKDNTAQSFVFDGTGMQVTYEPWGPNDPNADAAAFAFAAEQTANYDSYALESPAYGEAKRLAKMVSVVKWIKDTGIATDFEWARDYTPEYEATPVSMPIYNTPPIGTHPGFNGGLQYNTPNTYAADSGASATLKTASQTQSSSKEDTHWSFSSGGQDYKSVAVVADAFRTLGGFNTSATDFSSQVAANSKLELNRSYSSFSSGQKGIGRGWDMLPVKLTDTDPDTIMTCDGGSTWTDFPIQLSVQTTDGGYERFNYDCVSGYVPEKPYYYSTLERNVDGSNHTTGYTHTLKDQSKHVFDANLRLEKTIDMNGYAISYSYDGNDRLYSIIAQGTTPSVDTRYLLFNYGSNNNVSSVVDWSGRAVTYGYDTKGNLTSVTDPKGATVNYTYSANNKLLTVTDKLGATVVTNTYNSDAKVATKKDANNNTFSFSYDHANRRITATDGNSRVYKTEYDERARITKQTDPLLLSTVYNWFVDQNVPVSIQDKRGFLTQYDLDSKGNVLGIDYPDSTSIDYEYDTRNRLTKVSDNRYGSSPKETTFQYDNENNMTEKQEASKTTSYTYLGVGSPATMTDPSGHTTTWMYDPFGSKLTEQNALGQTSTYAYDTVGRIATQTDAGSKVKTFGYDLNNNVATITDSAGTTTNAYNANNKLTSITTPDNTTTTLTYDTSGNQILTNDALNYDTEYTYDEYNSLVSRQDALNHTTQYAYDSLNRRTQTTTPLGKVARWEYDETGNITKRIDESNRETSYQYDTLNRLVMTTYPDSSQVSNNYDDRGNLTSMTGMGKNSYFTYDEYNRLISETDPNSATVSYEYDAADNRTKVTYPGNKQVLYTYDAANQLKSVKDWNDDKTKYDYNPNGTLASQELPNGITASRSYDNANRISELLYVKGSRPVTKFAYERNAEGNVTKETEYIGTPAEQQYMIYDEGLQADWSDGWSWSSNVTLGDTTTPYEGDKSIKWESTYGWAGLHLRNTATTIDTSPYQSISFAVKASQPGQKVLLTLKGSSDSWLGEVDISMYGGNLTANGYKTYMIPLRAFNASYVQLSGLSFTDTSGSTQPPIHFDDIRLSSDDNFSPITYFDDATTGDAYSWSWNNTTLDNNATDVSYSGDSSMGITFDGAWGGGGLAIYSPTGTETYSHNSLSFALKGSSAYEQVLTVQLLASNGLGLDTEVSIAPYGGVPDENGFKVYTIPIAALGGAYTRIYGFNLQDKTGLQYPEIYLDDVKLTTTAAGPLTLYDDKLAQDTSDWSWDSTNDFEDTNVPYAGEKSIKSEFTSGYGGLRLNNWRGFKTSGYQNLDLAVKSSLSNAPATVQFTDQSGNGIGNAVPFSTFGSNPDTAYTPYSMPLGYFGLPSDTVYGIIIQEQSGAPVTFNFDDIKLSSPEFYYYPTAKENTFTYDDLGRLLTADYNSERNYTYAYDAVGNRITSNENGVSSYHFYNDDNQILTKASRTFTYDDQGNQVTDDSKIMEYDYDNRLVERENPATNTTVNFEYDHAGNRIEKRTGNTTHQFVNDTSGELSRVLVDKNTTDNANSYMLYGNEVISQGSASQGDRKYYISDGQGNARYITDSRGGTVEDYAYDPYGNEVATSPLSNFTFQEQQKDRETNLTYLRARYYDPTTGRFISKDPVEGIKTNPQSQNGYSYAHNDPVNLSDPSGEFIPLLIGGALLVWSAYDVSQGILNCDSTQATLGVIGLVPGVGPLSKVGKVVFKGEHVAKHLLKTDISQAAQEQVIRNDIVSKGMQGQQYVTRDIQINGQTFEYRAYQLSDGTISVGTYFPK